MRIIRALAIISRVISCNECRQRVSMSKLSICIRGCAFEMKSQTVRSIHRAIYLIQSGNIKSKVSFLSEADKTPTYGHICVTAARLISVCSGLPTLQLEAARPAAVEKPSPDNRNTHTGRFFVCFERTRSCGHAIVPTARQGVTIRRCSGGVGALSLIGKK